MKLGIMQPYFFPYAQQFRHIGQCDAWIVFDTPKFSRKSWVSRNRIANRDQGWSYISAPVAKGASVGTIGAARLADSGWRDTLYGQLQAYRPAPFYAETTDLVRACVAQDAITIAELNTRILRRICTFLGIATPIRRLSDLSLNLPETAAPGEWALIICKALGATGYSNASGGVHLFDPGLYATNGLALEFYRPEPLVYATPGIDFVPDLSIIDTLMWMGPDAVSHWCADRVARSGVH